MYHEANLKKKPFFSTLWDYIVSLNRVWKKKKKRGLDARQRRILVLGSSVISLGCFPALNTFPSLAVTFPFHGN